jgi:hypothetical protein
MVFTASRVQSQRYFETEQGNIATFSGTGSKVAVLTMNTALFPYIAVATTATTQNASLYVDASIDGINFTNLVNGTVVNSGTTNNYTLTNIGYRQVKISITQAGGGTTDVFYVLK